MTSQLQAEALIIGGGPSGAALAVHLARGGRAVTLIERSPAAHHKVCGEFLSREAVAYLNDLGLDPRGLGAVAVHGVRLHARGRIAACELPFPALSLTRRTLDEALLANAAAAGATVLRGRRVEALERTTDSWEARLTGGETCSARAVFLATGKHDLTGHRRPPGCQNDLVAFKLYFELSPAQQRALQGWVELSLFPGGYAGLQLVEDNQANLCLLVRRATLRRCRSHWSALFAHMLRFSAPLARRLDQAQPLLVRPLALSSIPYGLLPAPSQDGLWRLGDQAAVIPSFSGDGMSIALHSAYLAAQLYARGDTAAEFAGLLRRQLRRPVCLATALSRLMVAAPALAQAVRLWPGALGLLAAHTRIPSPALLANPLDLNETAGRQKGVASC